MTQTPNATPASGVVLLPPERFFARRVPLAAGAAAGGQIELALENFSPFPIEQLYHGYVASPGQDQALVFAAHRKQFPAAQAAEWDTANVVLPAFVALLGQPPSSPTIQVWRGAGAVTAAAWDGSSALPAAVVSRATGDAAQGDALIAELRARTGLTHARVEEFAGEPAGALPPDGRGVAFTIATRGGSRAGALAAGAASTADVREKRFLAERRRTGRRDLLLWRVFFGAILGLAALLVLELALAGGGIALRRLQDGVQQRAAGVEKISTAQSLSERIEELAGRRLMPFEMLTVLNRLRPPSVSFNRVTTTERTSLEVEAQTPNASDVGVYEAALRAAPELAKVETRDLRSREGTTSFVLTVTFKPETLGAGGAR